MFWSGVNQGDFDLKHAYDLAMGSDSDAGSFNGKWVWKLTPFLELKPLFGNAYTMLLV